VWWCSAASIANAGRQQTPYSRSAHSNSRGTVVLGGHWGRVSDTDRSVKFFSKLFIFRYEIAATTLVRHTLFPLLFTPIAASASLTSFLLSFISYLPSLTYVLYHLLPSLASFPLSPPPFSPPRLDVSIDGADDVDPNLCLIKGQSSVHQSSVRYSLIIPKRALSFKYLINDFKKNQFL
jgi:hypothetical protein